VGGRFSVLSAVGLLPAAMVGIDVDALLAGAREMVERCETDDLRENPAGMFAALQYLADTEAGAPIQVMMPYSDRLRDVADWFRQLWAESLGKRHTRGGEEVFAGPTPVKALGATDQHSQVQLYVEGPFDKTVTFLAEREVETEVADPRRHPEHPELAYLGGHGMGELLRTEMLATEAALAERGRMSMTLEVERVDARSLGALLMMLQIATVYAGHLYGVDPMDQPGVELGKELTYGDHGAPGLRGGAGRVGAARPEGRRLRAPLSAAGMSAPVPSPDPAPPLAGSRTLVVMNPAAGQLEAERALRLLAGAFAVRGAGFDVVQTAGAGDAEAAARRAVAEGYRAVVAVGGDGTVGEVIAGLAGTDVPLAIVPKGTANQVAGNLGIPRFIEGAVEVAVNGVPARIDLGRLDDGRYFALAAGAGWDAAVIAGATRKLKDRLGAAAPSPPAPLPRGAGEGGERRSRSRSCSCVRDSRPQGRDPAGGREQQYRSLPTRRLGCVGNSCIVAYAARSPTRSAAEGHAQTLPCSWG
jgi:hypothetical protein